MAVLARYWPVLLFLDATSLCLGGPTIINIALPTHDIVYDPVSDRIFASVPSRAGTLRGNSITPINPHTGAVGTSVFATSEPNKLALTDDGSRLYVASDSTNSVTPFSLSTMSPGMPFPIGDVDHRIEDMESVPGNSAALAVTTKRLDSQPRGVGVSVFVDGTKLPRVAAGIANVIEFGTTADILYGHNNETTTDFFSLSIDLTPSGGAQVITHTTRLVGMPYGQDIEFGSGRIYFTGGQIVDVNGPVPVGSFEASGPVEPVSSTGRTYFVDQNKLKSFSQATFVPLGDLTIPEFAGTAQDLIALGGSAVALTTTSDQLFIIRLPGDHDASGVVTAADYELWKANYGSTTNLVADANHDQIVDAADYVLWRENLGQSLVGSAGGASSTQLSVPEPAPAMMLCVVIASLAVVGNLRRRHCGFDRNSLHRISKV
jgi:hypothetical protein